MKGCAAGHRRAARASVMELRVARRNGLFSIRDVYHSSSSFTSLPAVEDVRRVKYTVWLESCVGQEVEVVVPSGSVRRGRMRIIFDKRFRRMPDVKRELDGGYPSFPASQNQWTSNEPDTRQKQMNFQSPQLRVVSWLLRMALEKPRVISLCSTTGNGADGEVRIRFNLLVRARASAK